MNTSNQECQPLFLYNPYKYSLGLGIVMANVYMLISTYWNIFKKHVGGGMIHESGETEILIHTNKRRDRLISP